MMRRPAPPRPVANREPQSRNDAPAQLLRLIMYTEDKG